MRYSFVSGFGATAFAAAFVIAGALPSSAQVARPLSALAVSPVNDSVIQIRGGGGFRGGGGGFRGGGGFHGGFRGGGMGFRGGHIGGYRGGGAAFAHRGAHFAGRHVGARHVVARHAGMRHASWHHNHKHHNHHRHHHHNHGDWWWGAGAVAVGYGLGYGYGYGYPYYGYGGYYDDSYYAEPQYCVSRVRVYNRATGTYVIRNRTVVCG